VTVRSNVKGKLLCNVFPQIHWTRPSEALAPWKVR